MRLVDLARHNNPAPGYLPAQPKSGRFLVNPLIGTSYQQSDAWRIRENEEIFTIWYLQFVMVARFDNRGGSHHPQRHSTPSSKERKQPSRVQSHITF